MKKLLICFCFYLSMSDYASVLYSQVIVVHKSRPFVIRENTELHIKGSLSSLKNNSKQVTNIGDIYISDSVNNYGSSKVFGPTPDTVLANVYLNGKWKQIFGGDSAMRFGNLYVRNSYDSIEAWNDVEIYNFIKLENGNLKLVTHTLDLLNTGQLIGEKNDRRVFSNEYGQIHVGRPLISGTTYSDIAGIGFDLTINGNLGTNVDVYRRNHQQINASNGSIDRYFYFNPQQNGYVSKPTIHYFDTNELHGNNENDLSMYHSESSGSTWLNKKSTATPTQDKVDSDPSFLLVLKPSTMLTLADKECDNPPYIHFSKDTIPLCGGSSAYIKPDGITGMASLWSTGVENKDSILISSAGTYKVTITDLAGCPNSDSIVVIAAPNPVADYTVAPVCLGDTSIFKNKSTIASGTVSYQWDMADVYTPKKDTTSDTIAKIVYTNQGTYTTNLVVTSNYGCSHSLAKSVRVLPYPIVDYTLATSCADSTLRIANNSSVTPTAGLLYRWDFNNGDTSTVATPSFSYKTKGTKTVNLTVTSNGCTSTLNKTVEINPNPTASFMATNVCLGDGTSFSNLSTVDSGSIAINFWKFESGANTTVVNPSYTYNTSGTFSVSLEVTTDQGCVDDTTIDVKVNTLPQPTFSSTSTCMGDSTEFVNTSNSTSAFKWDFTPVDSAFGYNSAFKYTSSGTNNVTLTETDTNGCMANVTKTINSKPRPSSNFTVQDGCEDANISFLNTSSTPSGGITYNWDFGNTTNSTSVSPSTTYSSANTYNVRLIAEVNGCLDTLIKPLTIHPNPVLNLGGTITTCAFSYVLDAQNTGSSYVWSNANTNQTITANYDGFYWAKVTNSFGCIVRDTVQVTLNSVVAPNLGADATFCDSTVLDAGYPTGSFIWSTGVTTQTITVSTTGSYWVEVTDAKGCKGSDTIVATIVTSVLPNLGANISTCNGMITNLSPSATGTSYQWNTSAITQTIDVTSGGTYWIELTDGNGCVNRDSIDVVYNTNPTLDLGVDTNYCDSAVFDATQSGVSYVWENSSTLPTRKITTAGKYWVDLTDLTTGCLSTDTVELTFSPRPVIDLGSDTIICNGATIVLDAQNAGGGNTYSWNVAGTDQTLTASSTGNFISFVTTPQGCVGNDTIALTVSDPFDTDLGDDFVLCQGAIAQLTSPVTGATYIWKKDSITLIQSTQSITINTYGQYNVEVTDVNGCKANDTINAIETGGNIKAKYLAKTNGIFEGDTIQFVNLTNPTPFTSIWDFGDGSYSIGEDPQHVYFSQGIYSVSLAVSNGICSDTISKQINVLPLRLKTEQQNTFDTILNSFSNVSLYPNPNNGSFHLDVDLLEEGELEVACFGITGKLIFKEEVYGKEMQMNYNFNNIESGVYFIRLRVNEEYKTLRFVKYN